MTHGVILNKTGSSVMALNGKTKHHAHVVTHGDNHYIYLIKTEDEARAMFAEAGIDLDGPDHAELGYVDFDDVFTITPSPLKDLTNYMNTLVNLMTQK